MNNLNQLATPFYFYDLDLLQETLDTAINEAKKYGYQLHYAIKANSNPKILSIINENEFGADCVSANEIKQALEVGFDANSIVFAGVGKTDTEIRYAIKQTIACFNCESLQEIQIINSIAEDELKIVNIAVRINPNINAFTHHYITTGKQENKFGISQNELGQLIDQLGDLKNIRLTGLHFHIGSQISDLSVFRNLCIVANELINWFTVQGVNLAHLNLGGGLGIDYQNPEQHLIPSFYNYFKTIHDTLNIDKNVKVHFEPGRSIVGQCGYLFTKVLYVKESKNKSFVIVDAGLTELIRPALYQSFHKTVNTSSDDGQMMVDIVGPICESSDCFGKNILFPTTIRGDLLKIYSAGAYGESMSSNYNLRAKAPSYFSNQSFLMDLNDRTVVKAS